MPNSLNITLFLNEVITMNNLTIRYGGGIRKRGNTYYYYFEGKKINGKRNKIEKSAKTKDKDEALSLLEKAIKLYYDSDIDFSESDISYIDAKNEFMNMYVCKQLKPSTMISYADSFAIPEFKILDKYLLKDITPTLIQTIVNDLVELGLKKTTIRVRLRTLSSLFCYYKEKGYIENNPCQDVTISQFAKPKDDIIALTEEESKAILNYVADTHWYLPMCLGLYTGMRKGECCRLRWENVDLDKGVIYIRENLVKNINKKWVITTPKTKSSIRDVIIPLPLHKALEWQIERNKANGIETTPNTRVLIRDNGKQVDCDNLKYKCRAISKALNIKFNYHKLRHTYATLLIEKGVNITDVSSLLGHSNTSITMDTYVNNTKNMRKKTINVLDTLFV